jgi:D-glycero-alpha-D-manno-heptose 1-phosphate guanylyltransferase
MTRPSVRAVLLAGGFGTRIQHLLPDRPKPMAPVAGRPFLEWIIRFLLKAGVHDFTLSTGYRGEVIAGHFAEVRLPGANIQCVPETTPLGTAGGFLHCAAATSEPPELWLVANGDSLALAPMAEFIGLMDDPSIDAAVLGVKMADAGRYGTLTIAPDGRLAGFAEKQPGAGVINAGVYLFRQRLLSRFPSNRPLSFETDVFPTLLALARVQAVARVAPFLDIGTPASLAEAEAFVTNHQSSFLV